MEKKLYKHWVYNTWRGRWTKFFAWKPIELSKYEQHPGNGEVILSGIKVWFQFVERKMVHHDTIFSTEWSWVYRLPKKRKRQ